MRSVRKTGSVEERRSPLGLRHSRAGSMDLVKTGRGTGGFGGDNRTGLSPEDGEEGGTDQVRRMGGMRRHMRCASDVVTMSDAVGAAVSAVRDVEGKERREGRVPDRSNRKPPCKKVEYSDTSSHASLVGWLPEDRPPVRRESRKGSDEKRGGRYVKAHSVGPGVPRVQKPPRRSHDHDGDDADVEEGSTPKGRRNKPVKMDLDKLMSDRCSPGRSTKPRRMESM